MIELTNGDILYSNAEAMVNTVNCVGVMGRGIALQFRRAFPDNFKAYQAACNRREVQPGKMFVFPLGVLTNPQYIINFPTKVHWKGGSRIEYIEAGLVALVEEVRCLGVRSIAVPPLGCGLGGLQWADVRPRIERAFDSLSDVKVLLFEPDGPPAPAAIVKEKKRPSMTAGRAILLGLMESYLTALMDDAVSLLEIHKLMYFMQEAGQPLKLVYSRAPYGPYATNLRHAMSAIDGHYITGYGDAADIPTKQILIKEGAIQEATSWLQKSDESQTRLERVADLIRGYETPFGLELLSTVHWVASQEGAATQEDAIERIYAWNERKRMFSERQIRIAWGTLVKKGWLCEPRSSVR